MRSVFVIVMLAFIVTGCTWVKLTAEGEKARVLSRPEVAKCKRLGQTTVSLKSTIAGVERNAEKVKKELETLARNHASDLNGDTVVPETEIKNGQQTFSVYRCIGE